MEAGGAQQVALFLTDGLRDKGHDVEVWFLYTKRPSYANMSGIRSFLPHPPKLLDYCRIAWRLWKNLQLHRPDVVITHTHYSNVLGHLLSRFVSVRHRIAVQHNPVDTYPRLARLADIILALMGCYTENILVSKAVERSVEHYPRVYRRKVKVIPNGLPPLPPVNSSKQELRLQWGLPIDKPLLLSVGRLAVQKNQSLLLQTLPHVPDTHLVLAGEGELRSQLEEMARALNVADRVHFLGEVSSTAIAQILRAADIFVFPSRFESMGLALVEAMLAELPIIASDIPALREVLGGSGIFADPQDARDWAGRICKLLADPEHARSLGVNASKRAAQFSVEGMVSSYATLMQ